jgi:hypothetical protein
LVESIGRTGYKESRAGLGGDGTTED